MKKHTSLFFVASLCAGLCTAAVIPAHAADSGLTLKAGGFVQTDSNAQGSNGNFAGGIEYDVVHPTRVSPFSISLYADVFAKSTGAGFSARSNTPVYVGAGVGLYHVSITQAGGGPANVCLGAGCTPYTPPTFTSNGAGGKIFGGVGISHGANIELGYHFMPSPMSGVSANTFSAELALRF